MINPFRWAHSLLLKTRQDPTIEHGIHTQRPPTNFQSFASQGYEKNELAFSCIFFLMTSAAEAKLTLVPNKDNTAQTPTPEVKRLQNLVDNPNPHLSGYSLKELIVLYLSLAGTAPIEKVRNAEGRVVELWTIRPDRLGVVPSPTDFIRNYTLRFGLEDFPVPTEDIIVFKYPHPTDPYFGMPPIQACNRQLAQDNKATDFSWSLLNNSAIPATVITTEKVQDDASAAKHRARWRQLFGGSRLGNVAFFQKGMALQRVSMNMDEIGFTSLRDISETRICGSFGVPPILVGARIGILQSAYRNYMTAKLSFWQETVSPLHERLTDTLNLDKELTPDGWHWHFDTSQVSALLEFRGVQNAQETALFQGGLITRNEARIAIGRPPAKGKLGDEYAHPLAWAARTPQGQFLTPDQTDTQPKETPDKGATSDES